MTVTELTTDRLADLITKRHRCLLQLRNLGHKQAELIIQGNMAPLLRLLGAKNQLIAAVQAIEQELNPFHEQNAEARAWPTEEARQKCAEQADQCRQLLDEVMQLEQHNEKKMTLRRDQVANQLQAAQAASTARSAYQAQQRSTFQGPHTKPLNTQAVKISNEGQQQLDLHSEV